MQRLLFFWIFYLRQSYKLLCEGGDKDATAYKEHWYNNWLYNRLRTYLLLRVYVRSGCFSARNIIVSIYTGNSRPSWVHLLSFKGTDVTGPVPFSGYFNPQ